MSIYINRDDALNELVAIEDSEAFILILNLPIADVVERRCGTWVLDEAASCGHTEYIYTCSACRNCTAWGETEKTRYCPNCGAKMDLED